MIDPILSLTFSLHSNKGVYALLLGSGVSRAAGIPTGWEIVVGLIRELVGEDCEPDPATWYSHKYGEEADYAKLLDAIAGSPSERCQLLRRYFEPTDEEREQGLKLPTQAHKAIARLIAEGYVRVIITTNFDRLLEDALSEIGIVPTVISTPDSAVGAIPLTHTTCSIIKVHGDYVDTRIKNTPAELAQYDPQVNALLDRIFDEFGLIVCGWSAKWDVALLDALGRCPNHRFTTYWTTRGEMAQEAQDLIGIRRARLVTIHDANSFFEELFEKVSALRDINRPHPASAKVAAATLKRYLPDDNQVIRVHDLVLHETERVCSELSDEHFPVQGVSFTPEELRRRVESYEARTEILQALVSTGCHWGKQIHETVWLKCLGRLANLPESRTERTAFSQLRLYPALLILYAGGIAALARERYDTFSSLLTKKVVRQTDRESPLVLTVYGPDNIIPIPRDVARLLPGMDGRHTPLSDRLCNALREPLRDCLPDDASYERCFDRFEYLASLVHADLREKQGSNVAGPMGSFAWRNEGSIMRNIEREVADMGADWPPLAAGLFDGSTERFLFIKSTCDGLFKIWLLG